MRKRSNNVTTHGATSMKFLLATLAAAFVLAFSASSVQANPHDPLPATLAISPASPPANSVGTLTGCGYIANANVRMTQYSEAGTAWYGIVSDSTGCISGENWNGAAGAVTIHAEQNICKPNGHCAFELMATLAYVISP